MELKKLSKSQVEFCPSKGQTTVPEWGSAASLSKPLGSLSYLPEAFQLCNDIMVCFVMSLDRFAIQN